MQTEFEASILTAAKVRDSQQHAGHPLVALGVMIVLFAIAGLATPRSAAQPATGSHDPAHAVAATELGLTERDSRAPSPLLAVPAESTFFYGYLEFDWDPSTLGPAPGFGALPPAIRAARAVPRR